jgi:phosphoheptose isomerase
MALEEARKRGLLTVALLGYDGGEILAPRRGRLSD